MKGEVWIQFRCGRKEKKADADYEHGSKHKGDRKKSVYVCKKHDNCFGKYKFRYCVDCGAKAMADLKTTNFPERCDPCREINKKTYSKKVSKHYRKKIKAGPRRVFSVADAKRNGVNCIPLERLFRVYKRMFAKP